jgi:hypothetical protein
LQAQATRAAGDEGCFAFDIEQCFHAHVESLPAIPKRVSFIPLLTEK